MAGNEIGQIESALRAGKAEVALKAAQNYAESAGNSREAALEIAKVAAAVYRDLIAPPVEEFAELAEGYLGGEAGTVVAKALQRLFRITEEWEKKLWDIHTERLIRELREWVRTGYLKPAAANVARLMALVPDGQRDRRAEYIGAVLGTVINNQKEAAQLILALQKNPQDHFLALEQVRKMDAARQKRHGELGKAELESLERQWSDNLTQAAVDIKNALPGSDQMGEPDEAVLRDAGDIFRSILRVPIVREDPELFLDAVNLLVEFVPKEQSSTAKIARIEQRTYNTLGVMAKRTVMMVLQDIGRNHFFTKMFKNWAKGYKQTDDIRQIVEVMGAFRSADFNDFFHEIKADKRVAGTVENQLSAALGTVAGAEAADELMSEMRGLLAHKRLATPELRQAERLVKGLANIIKSPRTEPHNRKKIREFLRSHVPEDIAALATYTAMQAMTFKPEELTAQQKQWAVRVLVRGLWMPDETTALHKQEQYTTELGFREETARALEKVAGDEVDALIRAMEPLTARFGTPFLAAADVLEKLGRPETLHLLERMLNTTLLHDDFHATAYQQDYYWDPTVGERRPLSKDKVIESLVYAIGTIGGKDAKKVLRRYLDQIATGRVPQPSGTTAAFMERFLGGEALGEEATEESSTEVAVKIGPADTDALIKQVSKRYLLAGKTKRRMKKVDALTKLARYTPLEALEAVFKQLANKDTMVASAAITCLSEYAAPNKPKAVRDLAINMCLETLESRDPAMRQGAIKLLRQIGPNRKDVKDKVLAFVKVTERREAREALADALRTGAGGGTPLEALAALGEGMPKPDNIAKLEAKKEYLAARQAWIAGGKKGDPPPKPPGVEW